MEVDEQLPGGVGPRGEAKAPIEFGPALGIFAANAERGRDDPQDRGTRSVGRARPALTHRDVRVARAA